MPLVIKHICNENIKSDPQFSAAIEYLLSNVVLGVSEEAFKEACGAGVVVTQDEIEDRVSLNKNFIFYWSQDVFILLILAP